MKKPNQLSNTWHEPGHRPRKKLGRREQQLIAEVLPHLSPGSTANKNKRRDNEAQEKQEIVKQQIKLRIKEKLGLQP